MPDKPCFHIYKGFYDIDGVILVACYDCDNLMKAEDEGMTIFADNDYELKA